MHGSDSSPKGVPTESLGDGPIGVPLHRNEIDADLTPLDVHVSPDADVLIVKNRLEPLCEEHLDGFDSLGDFCVDEGAEQPSHHVQDLLLLLKAENFRLGVPKPGFNTISDTEDTIQP